MYIWTGQRQWNVLTQALSMSLQMHVYHGSPFPTCSQPLSTCINMLPWVGKYHKHLHDTLMNRYISVLTKY